MEPQASAGYVRVVSESTTQWYLWTRTVDGRTQIVNLHGIARFFILMLYNCISNFSREPKPTMSELMKDSFTAKDTSSAELAERLQAHPNVLARVSSLLDLIENQDNNCETASGTELKIISELQKMGNDALQDWGNSQQKKKAQ